MKINLNRASAENTQDILYVKNYFMAEEDFNYQDMKDLILNENVFEITVDEKIAGIICTEEDTHENLNIKYFFILPEYQNMGIGGFVLNSIFDKFYYVQYFSVAIPEKFSCCVKFFRRYGFNTVLGSQLKLEKFEENTVKTAEKFFENPVTAETSEKCEQFFSNSLIGGKIFIIGGNISAENSFKSLFSRYILSEKDFSMDKYKENLYIRPFEKDAFWSSFTEHLSRGMEYKKCEEIYRRCHNARIIQIYDAADRKMFFGHCGKCSFLAEYGIYC